MTEQEFAEIVVMELRESSMMTYSLSKKKYKKFQKFFLRRAKNNLNWDKWQRRNEFDRFCQAFKVKVK